MMSDKTQSSCSSSSSSRSIIKPVASLNAHDVLLGKGTGPYAYCGNVAFRAHVLQRRDEYISASGGKGGAKSKIAKQVLDHVHSLGGRFLRQDGQVKAVRKIVKDGKWYECSEQVALEKIQQALRQHRGDPADSRSSKNMAKEQANEAKGKANEVALEKIQHALRQHRGDPADSRSSKNMAKEQANEAKGKANEVALEKIQHALRQHRGDPADSRNKAKGQENDEPWGIIYPSGDSPSRIEPDRSCGLTGGGLSHLEYLSARPPTSLMPVLPPTLVGFSRIPVATHARLLLFQRDHFVYQPFGRSFLRYPCNAPFPSRAEPDTSLFGGPYGSLAHQQFVQAPSVSPDIEHGINGIVNSPSRDAMALEQSSTEHVASVPEEGSSVAVPEGDLSEFLLSVLALFGRPKFTDQDRAIEKANMADEEKAKVLADLFGKYCNVHQNKKAKRDLSKDDVAFLVKQMRLEIDKIPESEKGALIEAMAKCRADDFCDSRMEKFLRCEKMDVEVRGPGFFTVGHVTLTSHI